MAIEKVGALHKRAPEVRQLVEEVRKLGIVEQAACTKTRQKAAARANTHSK